MLAFRPLCVVTQEAGNDATMPACMVDTAMSQTDCVLSQQTKLNADGNLGVD